MSKPTRVLFVRLAPWMGILHPHPQDAPYAFDVAQTAALLDPRRYDVSFIDGVVEELTADDMVERVRAVAPDVLALTATSSAASFASEIFARARASSPAVYLIGFGQHAHYSPETFLSPALQVDACVYGEAEATLAELIQAAPRTAAHKAAVRGIHYWDGRIEKTPERPLNNDLDQWPMPRYELFKGHDYRIVSNNFNAARRIKAGWILASRGCPYPCTICSPAIRRSFGAALRKHSPRRVADSFEFLRSRLGVNSVYFGDDTFSLDMRWAEAVCDELIARRNTVQWGISTRADKLSTVLIEKMKAAGLRAVALGMESGSERILREIKKGVTLEQIEWALAELARHEISVNVTAIVGHVDETADELDATLSFLKRSSSLFVQLHYLAPYPGTKVAQVFRDRLGAAGEVSHFNAAPMNVSKIPDDVLRGAVQRFYLDYYLSWAFFKKYVAHRLRYLLGNPIREGRLIKDSLAYFLDRRPRPRETARA